MLAQLHPDAAAVPLFNPDLNVLQYASGRGFRGEQIAQTRLKLGEGYAEKAAMERRIAKVDNASGKAPSSPAANLMPEECFVTLHCVPIVAKGQIKGILEIFHRTAFEPDSDWLSFLEMLAVVDVWDALLPRHRGGLPGRHGLNAVFISANDSVAIAAMPRRGISIPSACAAACEYVCPSGTEVAAPIAYATGTA
jgi:hypothetical protein